MGMDVYALVEVKVGEHWLMCRENGEIYNSELTLKAGTPAIFVYTEATCECMLDVPRNPFRDYTLLGWEEEVDVAFNTLDVDELSYVTEVGKEYDDHWIYRITLDTFDDYEARVVEYLTVTREDSEGQRKTLAVDDFVYVMLRAALKNAMEVNSVPREAVRLIMYYQ